MQAAPLAGLQVVETGASVAVAMCAKYLAELGASVAIQQDVARPGRPDHWSADLVGYLDDAKTVAPVGEEIDSAATDVVLGDGPSQLPPALPPTVITGTVTDHVPVVAHGPQEGGDLLAHASSGLLMMVGDPTRSPLALGGHQLEFTAGLALFTGVLLALRHRETTGEGQAVDTSLLETAAYVEWKGRVYAQTGSGLVRGDRSGPFVAHCSDGPFGFYYRPTDWPAVVEVLGSERLADERFAEHRARLAHHEELAGIVDDVCAGITRDELYHRLQAAGVPAGPIYDATDLLHDEQYAARELIVAADATGAVREPALPVRFDDVRPRAAVHG